mgnify:CR=1 FL=1
MIRCIAPYFASGLYPTLDFVIVEGGGPVMLSKIIGGGVLHVALSIVAVVLVVPM